MKKLLYIILVINIISLILAFFMILGTSVFYAVIFALLGCLELVPIIALISCLDNIENLQADVSYHYYKFKQLEEKSLEENQDNTTAPPKTNNPDTAIATWKCVKCDTVNKAGTNHCANCKAPYSPFVNPTSDPNAKKKISRWVKYK